MPTPRLPRRIRSRFWANLVAIDPTSLNPNSNPQNLPNTPNDTTRIWAPHPNAQGCFGFEDPDHIPVIQRTARRSLKQIVNCSALGQRLPLYADEIQLASAYGDLRVSFVRRADALLRKIAWLEVIREAFRITVRDPPESSPVFRPSSEFADLGDAQTQRRFKREVTSQILAVFLDVQAITKNDRDAINGAASLGDLRDISVRTILDRRL